MGAIDKVFASAQSARVVVFTTSFCGYCKQALAALKAANIEFMEHDNSGSVKTDVTKATGKTSSPSVWVCSPGLDGANDGARVGDWMHIGGCNDGPKRWQGLIPLLRNGQLKQMIEQLARSSCDRVSRGP